MCLKREKRQALFFEHAPQVRRLFDMCTVQRQFKMSGSIITVQIVISSHCSSILCDFSTSFSPQSSCIVFFHTWMHLNWNIARTLKTQRLSHLAWWIAVWLVCVSRNSHLSDNYVILSYWWHKECSIHLSCFYRHIFALWPSHCCAVCMMSKCPNFQFIMCRVFTIFR